MSRRHQTPNEVLKNLGQRSCNGKLDANEAEWANFKVMVTNADGTTKAYTLAQLGITEIDLSGDATNIELPDGPLTSALAKFSHSGDSTNPNGNVS